MMTEKIRLGISQCLLGDKVRYDGGQKKDPFLVHTLGQYVEYVPVCPEVEIGLPVPREAMRLVGDPQDPRLITIKTKIDHTDTMKNWASQRVVELESEDLSGFIFKSKSPSSGYERVKVYQESGMPIKKGVGLFARAFTEHFPLLPAEEEGRLHDPGLRENFIERIFVYNRWRNLVRDKLTPKGLVDFHTQHKLLIMSHSTKHYNLLGKIMADVRPKRVKQVVDEYQTLLMEALRLKTTIRKHTNVLQHIMGYFKKVLTSDEKQEMLDIIAHYHNGHVPLIVPTTLLNHYVRKYDQPYLKQQYYLQPHPIELQLRNHV